MALTFLCREIADRKGCTASQLCLAWVLAQGDDFVSIPGTKKEKYLRENLGGLDVVLTKEELAEIDAIIDCITTVGERSVHVSLYLSAPLTAHYCLAQVSNRNANWGLLK
jgi:diketogulonate reductase-like aldo/keto reductase